MAGIKVILQSDVPNLGRAGEVKQVTPGYFRNYLQPRGLAVEASKGQMTSLKVASSSKAAQATRERERVDALARQMQDVTLRIPVKVGQQGRIYGSVTNKDVAQALAAQANISVDRHKIELRDPLRTVGTHSVPVRLEHGVEAHVRVEVVPEEEAARA